jgi:hypothetical protein
LLDGVPNVTCTSLETNTGSGCFSCLQEKLTTAAVVATTAKMDLFIIAYV